MMTIGLAVVGIAVIRSQGCGIAELPNLTKHSLCTVLTAGLRLPPEDPPFESAAKAEALNATAIATIEHRTDQIPNLWNWLIVFMPPLFYI